jgi:hypothetical protein
MLQYSLGLLPCNTGEPINKFRELGTVIKVLKEGGNRDPRASKHPSPTGPLGIALDRRTA